MSLNLQGFFESTAGQAITVILIIVLFLTILISGKGQKPDTKALVSSAILAAMAIVLGLIKVFELPQGGSITAFSMLPIALCGYFFGLRKGTMVGICVGLINLIFNPYIIHPIQMILDYPLAFGALAFGAIFRNKGKYSLIFCYLFGVFCRYWCAVLSGIIFFGQYAPKNFNAVTWSLWYNFTYLSIEAAITTAVLLVPVIRTTFDKIKFQALPGKY